MPPPLFRRHHAARLQTVCVYVCVVVVWGVCVWWRARAVKGMGVVGGGGKSVEGGECSMPRPPPDATEEGGAIRSGVWGGGNGVSGTEKVVCA